MLTRNIRNLLLLGALLLGLQNVSGQQEPQYTQYMFNMMSVNPAYAGTRESLNALVLSRMQWVGLEGAPRSNTIALHTPFRNRKMGLGASIITDRIGPVTNSYININYAYRISLTEDITLSLGLKGGIYNYYVGLSDLALNASDITYDEDYKKNFQPNLGAGAYLYTKDYYVGFSVPKMLKTELEDIGTTSDLISELKRHFFITGGYIFTLDADWKLKPSVLAKMVEGAPPSFDITAQALYRDRFWLGTTYRTGDALAFLFQMQINPQLILGYSFDLTLSAMSSVTSGSHEILISYDFKAFTNDKVKSPRYF